MNFTAFAALVRRDLRLFFLDKRAMTMSFEVKDPVLLAQLTPGERVRFTLEKTQETLYLVAVEKDEGEGSPPASLPPLPSRGKGVG